MIIIMCETMVSRSFPDANCQTSITMIIMNIVLQSGLKKKKSSVENARHLGAPLPCHLLLCAAGAGAALVSSKKKRGLLRTRATQVRHFHVTCCGVRGGCCAWVFKRGMLHKGLHPHRQKIVHRRCHDRVLGLGFRV